MRISDWSSDVCSSDLIGSPHFRQIATKPNILAALKKCEGIFIPFASQGKTGNVTVNLGSKGIIELELVASGAKWGRGPKGDVNSSLTAMVESTTRTEERHVGKEVVRTFRYRGSPTY